MFYEDPILPDNFDAMAEVASQIGIPIATGERLMGVHEFQMLLERRAAQYARICVCVAGGISGAKKIAALAEAHHKFVIPHNPLSPISTAACLQLDASIPNLAIQELPDHADEFPDKDLLKERLRVENGFLIIPNGPGIGVELVDDVREKFPPKPRPVGTRLNVDGSVIDQ
jgi:galactonate dehydratase